MKKTGTIRAVRNGEALRDKSIKGWWEQDPEVGKNFVLWSASRDIENGVRYVRTSKVQRVLSSTPSGNYMTFETRNSVYELLQDPE